MAVKRVYHRAATVQTTDATQTTILSITLPDASIQNAVAFVEAREPATGDSKIFQIEAGIKRHAGGGATLVGTVRSVIPGTGDVGAVLWDTTFDVSGNDVRLRVTGQAAKTIEWFGRVLMDSYVP